MSSPNTLVLDDHGYISSPLRALHLTGLCTLYTMHGTSGDKSARFQPQPALCDEAPVCTNEERGR